MKFIKHDLGFRSGGELVEVKLTNAAFVRMLDSPNFKKYRYGQFSHYYGGYVNRSPIRLQIPDAGYWYVVVDLGGYAGQVGSTAEVLPGEPPAVQERPLASMPSLIRDIDEPEYDVFILHAPEDKDEVVRPLALALREGSLSVCDDAFELKIGDSLRHSIDKGIASSRFGVVVLSKAFFNKAWPNHELNGLVTQTISGDQVLLPIWHNITKDEAVSYSPTLADKLARHTAINTVEEIAAEIIDVLMAVPV